MAEVIARVGRITGEAVARDPDGNVRRLKSGDPIREGDVVQAADGAQVALRLADGRDLTVNANEAARIDAEVAAPDLPDAGDSAVQNNPRGFLKVAKAIVGADGTFSFGDDAGQVRNAADQKDGHSFIELVRIVELVEPLSFQFATTRFPLNDTIEGGPAALFDALNAATAASIASQSSGVLLVDGATRVTAARACDSGIAGDNLTNDATPTIRGTGEPGATVTVTSPTGEVLTTTVAADSTWSVTPGTALPDGAASFAVTATDAAGNTASTMVSLTVNSVASATITVNAITADNVV